MKVIRFYDYEEQADPLCPLTQIFNQFQTIRGTEDVLEVIVLSSSALAAIWRQFPFTFRVGDHEFTGPTLLREVSQIKSNPSLLVFSIPSLMLIHFRTLIPILLVSTLINLAISYPIFNSKWVSIYISFSPSPYNFK